MRTMVRMVLDDFHALLMCNAIEAVGGRPFSVVHVPAQPPRHSLEYGVERAWHVFGQVPDAVGCDDVDSAYEALCASDPPAP